MIESDFDTFLPFSKSTYILLSKIFILNKSDFDNDMKIIFVIRCYNVRR